MRIILGSGETCYVAPNSNQAGSSLGSVFRFRSGETSLGITELIGIEYFN